MKTAVKQIFKFLNKPFPEETSIKQTIKTSFLVGLFIFLFLFVIQPFGMNVIPDKRFIYSLYFGLATFGVAVVYDIFFLYVFKIKTDLPTWTFYKWILNLIILLILITFANYFIMRAINDWEVPLNWEIFKYVFLVTLSVGIFPIVFFGAIKMARLDGYNRKIAESIEIAKPVNTPPKIIYTKEGLTLKSENFLYAQSMQNYINIYSKKEGGIRKDTIRSTLNDFINTVEDEDIMRCHRSFVVNLIHVHDVEGNAQGLKLSIDKSNEIVPVSRKYIPLVKQKMA